MMSDLRQALVDILNDPARARMQSRSDLVVLLRDRGVALPQDGAEAWHMVSEVLCDIELGRNDEEVAR